MIFRGQLCGWSGADRILLRRVTNNAKDSEIKQLPGGREKKIESAALHAYYGGGE